MIKKTCTFTGTKNNGHTVERKQIIEIYKQGPEAVVNLVNGIIEAFSKEIAGLKETIARQDVRIKDLEDKLSKNSSNSSKPPSSDGFKKVIKSNRKKTHRKQGGQSGHKGHKLEMVDNPDTTKKIELKVCEHCKTDLKYSDKIETRRQVFDIPKISRKVIEYRTYSTECPCCGKSTSSKFPDGVNRPVQYGENIRALVVYLSQYQLIPYERTTEFLTDLFQFPISQGTLYNILNECYNNLEKVEKSIVQKIKEKSVVHFDESGGYCEKIRQWFHVVSTEYLTFYSIHRNRGTKAIDDIGILPELKGIAVHDCYSSYFKYDKRHILCNPHLLRELKFLYEECKQPWAEEMEKLILEIKEEVDNKKLKGKNSIPNWKKDLFYYLYDSIVKAGLKKYPQNKGQSNIRGRKKQTKSRRLLIRLEKWKFAYLGFMEDFTIPFDNNLSERDIRMLKLQQKISGCFRSIKGAQFFCRIRGYISTARKNGKNVYQALIDSFFLNENLLTKFAE